MSVLPSFVSSLNPLILISRLSKRDTYILRFLSGMDWVCAWVDSESRSHLFTLVLLMTGIHGMAHFVAMRTVDEEGIYERLPEAWKVLTF